MKTKIILITIAALLIIQGARVTRDAGILRSLEPVAWGECQMLEGPVGGEDITIDPIRKVAYIGADDRRAYLIHGDQNGLPNGGLWQLDLSKPDAVPTPIAIDIEGPFHPHGIALNMTETGGTELYVINHITPTQHSVEIFTISETGAFALKRRISFPEMISPNDLVVAGDNQFFMTNDHGNPRHTLMETVEDYLGLPLSNVVYFDGQKAHVVIEGLRMANGVQLSADKGTLYVAETTGRRITRFSKGETNKDWYQQDSIDVDSGVDNLEWDEQGRLLTGSHPKLFDFLGHVNDGNALSASEAIRVDVSGDQMAYEIIHLDLGEALSGSSVAATLGDTLIMGPVFEPHILRCQR